MNRKVTVVGGAGNVGATVARAIADKELADVVIIDIADQKAGGVQLLSQRVLGDRESCSGALAKQIHRPVSVDRQQVDQRDPDQRFGELSQPHDRIGPPEPLVQHHLLAVVRPAFDESG